MSNWPTKKTDLKVAAALNLPFSTRRDTLPFFITISREFGCDGVPLAQYVCKELNRGEDHLPWVIHDRHSLLKIADQAELNDDMMALLDQYGHSEIQGYLQEAIFGQKSQFMVVQTMAKIIRVLARRGHGVFLGRGASVLTKDLPRGVHIRLFAPFDWRVDNFAKSQGIDRDLARKTVQKNQDIREGFLKTYLAESITNPLLYDIMINRKRVGWQTAADTVLAIIEHRRDVST